MVQEQQEQVRHQGRLQRHHGSTPPGRSATPGLAPSGPEGFQAPDVLVHRIEFDQNDFDSKRPGGHRPR